MNSNTSAVDDGKERYAPTNVSASSALSCHNKRAEFKAPILAQYDEESDPYYATARLWDDGILIPAQTRTALAFVAALKAPFPDDRYGTFRM